MSKAPVAQGTSSKSSILEGILAVDKPQGISSAQVLRDMQKQFNPSTLFAPWLKAETERLQQIDAESRDQRRRRKRRQLGVKIGHGGTLDPLATGVLVTGIGSGTKSLQGFLACTKSYEATVLFGVATDTYDCLGKILDRAPYRHITRQGVEKALDAFRGKIVQRPPIFSALRVQGKRLYEYAREGKVPPVEIEVRPVEVHELELTEWIEGGSHDQKWPASEAEEEEKRAAKLLHDAGAAVPSKAPETIIASTSDTAVNVATDIAIAAPSSADAKRKRESFDDAVKQDFVAETPEKSNVMPSPKRIKEAPDGKVLLSSSMTNTPDASKSQADHDSNPNPPAIKIRLTCTSGFYVRSLCDDLGKALGSLAIMTELVRTRQGDYKLGENVLPYSDLALGEAVWGPKVARLLGQPLARDETYDPGNAVEEAVQAKVADS
ncbi:MAG: hypothetical protein M1825_003213 [Sarcosagium campestre]|nr:MAG: hypothetical protein M1825_003213 [Sarcosagium campestre]